MENTREITLSIINEALQKLDIERKATKDNIEKPTNKNFGDLSSNIALVLSKELKKSPLKIANEIVSKFPKNKDIIKVEIAKPGFINFHINPQIYIDNLDKIEKEGEKYGHKTLSKNKRVLIDYSSPNIAKSFGVGHLRSTIIGQAIYNIYKALGWDVIGDNHLGDWGTQFGMIIAAIKMDNLNINKMSVKDLEDLYVNFNKEIENNPKLKDKAREAFSDLEKGEKTATDIWKKAVDISLKEFQKIYDLLGVKIDYAFGESYYQNMMQDIIDECKEKRIAKMSQGALIVEFDNLPPAMLVKSNGTTTYLTRDLATIKFRENTDYLKSDLYIYEVGVPQTNHFNQLFEIAKKLGLGENAKFVHVAHGIMKAPGGEKMSTRKGTTIKLDQLLSKAKSKAIEMMKNKLGNDLDQELIKNAEKIGIGAIKYNELKRSPKTDYTFEWEEALSMDGNTAPYIQYTQRRADSIIEKARKEIHQPKVDMTMSVSKEELSILKLLYEFPNIIQLSGETFSPNRLVSYLFELAQAFNTFYNSEKIIGHKKEALKLKITKSVSQTLKNGLMILGIETVAKM